MRQTSFRAAAAGQPGRGRRVYQVSGFVFESGLKFPELPGAEERAAKWHFRIGGGHHQPVTWFHDCVLRDGRSWPAFGRQGPDYVLCFEGAAEFRISRAGEEIAGRSLGGTPAATLRRLFLDQVLPLLLNLLGRESLHASAVMVNGGACAFLGPTGAGKSTLAASFRLAGIPMLSDDALPVEQTAEGFAAIPNCRASRLWPEAASALGHPEVSFAEDGPCVPAPLVRAYLLEDCDAGHPVRITAVSPAEALPNLLEHAFRLDLQDRAMLERQFRFLSRLASAVPVRRLRYPRQFPALPLVRDAILDDLESRP